MALSMLTPSGVAALGTAGVTAAQTDAPLPPPPPPPAYRDSSDTTLLLIGSSIVLLALLALAVSQGGDRDNDEISPD